MRHYSLLRFISFVIISLSLIIATSVQAKDKKIAKKDLPAAVLSAFQKSYPNATIKGQSKEEENKTTFFEIESVDGKINRDILYTADGKATEIEETISKDDLPKTIQATLKTQYAKSKILKMEKITHDSSSGYEIKIQTGKKITEILFDSTGKLLKSVGKKNKNEEDEEDDENEDSDYQQKPDKDVILWHSLNVNKP
jgi:hypothetical protein